MKTLRLVIASCTLLLAPCTLLLAGCVPSMIMKHRDRSSYSDYVQSTNQLNTDREKSGLAPVPVMTFDQWRGEK